MVRLAIVGLGRMGKSHAENLRQIPGCEIVSACSVIESELEWAQRELGLSHEPPFTTQLWQDYSRMLQAQDCAAVFLSTPSNLHGEQIAAALEAGKHVFCEKPLGVSVADCRKTAELVAKYQDSQIFMPGFVRRFDPAYSYAKQKIREGLVGEPYMVRSQTADHRDFAPFQLGFCATSGGIFHDMGVHDMDLLRWYLEAEPLNAYALASSLAFPEFDRIGDADNVVATCEFEGGKIGVIQVNRCASHGHNTHTEIYGTEGVLRIGFRPARTDVEILDKNGQRSECVHTFQDRFAAAFRLEAQEFIACIEENRPPIVSCRDALQATLLAEACTLSMKEKRKVALSEMEGLEK